MTDWSRYVGQTVRVRRCGSLDGKILPAIVEEISEIGVKLRVNDGYPAWYTPMVYEVVEKENDVVDSMH